MQNIEPAVAARRLATAYELESCFVRSAAWVRELPFLAERALLVLDEVAGLAFLFVA